MEKIIKGNISDNTTDHVKLFAVITSSKRRTLDFIYFYVVDPYLYLIIVCCRCNIRVACFIVAMFRYRFLGAV